MTLLPALSLHCPVYIRMWAPRSESSACLCSVLLKVGGTPGSFSGNTQGGSSPGVLRPAQPGVGGVLQAQAELPHLLSSWPLWEPLSHSVPGSHLCSAGEKGEKLRAEEGGAHLHSSTIRTQGGLVFRPLPRHSTREVSPFQVC